MKDYLVNNFKATHLQYAMGQSLPIWGDLEGWSRERMFEKYPSISPYTYCANNPIIMIDEKGEFPIKIHKLLVGNAIKGTQFEQHRTSIIFGTGYKADIGGIKNSLIHLDGMNYSQLVTGYNNGISKFLNGIKNNSYSTAGEGLHTVADFYAHSNYIELYAEYANLNGKELDVNNIPTFEEGMKIPEFNKLLKEKLHTGSYGGTGNIVADFILDKILPFNTTHNNTNKDTRDSKQGRKQYGNTIKYVAAFTLAKKAINNLIQENDK